MELVFGVAVFGDVAKFNTIGSVINVESKV